MSIDFYYTYPLLNCLKYFLTFTVFSDMIHIMKYIKIILTDKQKHELNRVEKDMRNMRLLKRIPCVKLKDAGWTNIKIAELLHVCNNTIADWLQAYVKNGIDGV